MKKFLNDIKTATAFFRDLRRQKPNDDIRVYPCIVTEYCFMDTIEGSVLFNCDKDIYVKVSDFFKTLPLAARQSLSLSFENGGYIDRANFWRQALKQVLTEKEYQIAVRRILHWYIHCKQLKMKGA